MAQVIAVTDPSGRAQRGQKEEEQRTSKAAVAEFESSDRDQLTFSSLQGPSARHVEVEAGRLAGS